MGKDLKGKELGNGITQRKDGRYMARFTVDGKTHTIYEFFLKNFKKEILRNETFIWNEQYNQPEQLDTGSVLWFLDEKL